MEMEVVRERRRVCREMSSPDHEKRGRGVCVQTRIMRQPTFKKVQVVYYLSRNGHLQHPHYMEVTHLAHQQLRLKDVMDRLTVLRQRHALTLLLVLQKDVLNRPKLHCTEVSFLKLWTSEKLHHLQVGNAGQDSNFQPKRKSLGSKQRMEPDVMTNRRYDRRGDDDGGNAEEDDEEEEYEEKTSCTSSMTPHSRCSRVSPLTKSKSLNNNKRMQERVALLLSFPLTPTHSHPVPPRRPPSSTR
ncbi:UNVERIFIED_CONTAM: protein UPSTREAM OF FLC [Sesamum angustifolium]|uniref:Protein UPSTREAM OF FLC n=1 Tax=Sesamum angustifolium TaxID=2727405 RepID=A0AAW2NKN6_9LAMI